jgi:hypothetical protein
VQTYRRKQAQEQSVQVQITSHGQRQIHDEDELQKPIDILSLIGAQLSQPINFYGNHLWLTPWFSPSLMLLILLVIIILFLLHITQS